MIEVSGDDSDVFQVKKHADVAVGVLPDVVTWPTNR
jgi:hypothetical protein